MAVKYILKLSYAGQGWSEEFYRNTYVPNDSLSLLSAYIIARQALLATQCTIISLRASDVNTARDVRIFPTPVGGFPGSWAYLPVGATTPLATAPHQVDSALALRLSDGLNHFRNFGLLGLPDHVVADSIVVPAEEAMLNSRITAWLATVQALGFSMRIQLAPTVSGPIATFGTQTLESQLVKIVTPAALPANGTHVQIKTCKPFSSLNRIWKVAESGAGQFSLVGSSKWRVFNPVESGTWQIPVYDYALISQYTISRVSTRKTGIPFGQQRGRR